MSNDLPLRFDPVLFANRGRQFAGNIPVQDMPRLMELAPESDGEFYVTMAFSMSSLQFPMVKGTIEGEVVQSCQRCMENATVPISGQFQLLLITPDSLELASEEGHEIFVYEGQVITTATLIEDEIILSMPIVVKHKDTENCESSVKQWIHEFDEVPTDKKENPFAKLKDLKL
jgi:uncharacterized protein